MERDHLAFMDTTNAFVSLLHAYVADTATILLLSACAVETILEDTRGGRCSHACHSKNIFCSSVFDSVFDLLEIHSAVS